MAANQMEKEGSSPKRLKTDTKVDAPGVTEKGLNTDSSQEFEFSSDTTLEDLRQLNEKFIQERNWHQFHSPRNVLLDLVAEVGELAEIFQWKSDVSEGIPELSVKEREHVGEELSDVLFCVLNMATRCRVDLPAAAMAKMAANKEKYPVSKAYGKPNKYTDYQEKPSSEQGSQM